MDYFGQHPCCLSDVVELTDGLAVFLGAAGHPQKDVSPKNVKASLQVRSSPKLVLSDRPITESQILAGQGVCYGVAMTSSKLSICLLYKRIFAVQPFR